MNTRQDLFFEKSLPHIFGRIKSYKNKISFMVTKENCPEIEVNFLLLLKY